ncbi:MAG: hypothetical protein L6R41_008346 [Letrouitia leprolyta]|nr:MAG: hypothetical protein L6R41_008346 [Letrouitia leprolyta]
MAFVNLSPRRGIRVILKVILAIVVLWQTCCLWRCISPSNLDLQLFPPYLFTFEATGVGSQNKDARRESASTSLDPKGNDTIAGVKNQRTQPGLQTVLGPYSGNSLHLDCHEPLEDRYAHLRSFASPKTRFFFALDLFQAASVMPQLLIGILHTIKFLGPKYCYLSIVEGTSTDGTSELLLALRREAEKMGFPYSLVQSAMDSKSETNDRIETLSKLRNLAIAPLLKDPSPFDTKETTIIFINDISLCPNDILELVHQRRIQGADMACPMDYSDDGLFYDVWVARSMTGDIFFEIPPSGLWKYAKNLLWDDTVAKRRLNAHKPFQVFSCWNGMAAISVKPFLEKSVRFRRNHAGECYMGEPTLLCKDFWANGFGKILVVPSVWVAYSQNASVAIKQSQGYVEDHVGDSGRNSGLQELINWEGNPPSRIKCPIPSYADPQWILPYEGFNDSSGE